MTINILVFDLYGDYGHFRKYYTTTSPLTFSFPPAPTIAGILGAIYGASRTEYLELFGYDSCRIALRILNPIRKVRMGINYINTKDNMFRPIKTKYHEPRTQIRVEFVKSPAYRIYVSHQDDEIFNILANLIKLHQSFYTVSLGLSELVADFKFVGKYKAIEVKDTKAEVVTVIRADNLIESGIEIQPSKKYFKEKIPIKMTPNRVVEIYEDVIYEAEGKTITAHLKTFYQLSNGENICFF